MDLIVDAVAAARSSRGVRRYVETVMRHLQWPGKIFATKKGGLRTVDRLRELLYGGDRNAVLWTPCQRGSVRAKNHVVTVHDCINVEYIYRSDWRLPLLRAVTQRLLESAVAVVAISDTTRDAILRNYRIERSKIAVIRSSCEVEWSIFHGPGTSVSKYDTVSSLRDEPYILMVTNSLKHKNTLRACLALATSRAVDAGVCVRVVGSLEPEGLETCKRNNLRVYIENTVSDERLVQLYDHCLFFLSPSLSEGHNIPIAEALSRDANVLCSDISAHREFYINQVEYFDPLKLEAMTAAIDRAIYRSGTWYPRAKRQRSIDDVAADYRRLFLSIC